MNSVERKRPGEALDSSHLYEIKVGPDGEQLGVHDLEHQWHPFNNGETIEFDQVEGVRDRVPIIRTADGKKIPFEAWAAGQR